MRLSLAFACVALLCLALPATGQGMSDEVKQWLGDFYDAMDGDNWKTNTNWKSDTIDPCEVTGDPLQPGWFGITCNGARDRIRLIDLPDNDLVGSLPDISVIRSVFVSRLDLSDNDITGVPEDWSSFNGLITLRLSGSLSKLPDSWAGLELLRVFELSNTMVTDLPDSWAGLGDLRNMDFRNNRIEQVPDDWTGLDGINVLNMGGNDLTTIPSWSGLEATSINFNNNRIKTLPSSWEDLADDIVTVFLNNNKIEGIPASWQGLESATRIELEDNFISTLPDEWEFLDAITTLDLQGNLISKLPDTWEHLETVVTLLLQGNRIRIVPKSWTGLQDTATINLSRNQIIAIPDSWTGLDGVTTLNLNNNDIRGTIPGGPVISGLLVTLNANELCGALPDTNTEVNAPGGQNFFDCVDPDPAWCNSCRCRPAQAACCPADQFLVPVDGYTGGECRYNCPRGTYQNEATYEICTPCAEQCETCFGPSAGECFSCNEGSFLQGTSCKADCSEVPGTFGRNGVCVPCPFECAECDADGCTTCEADFPLKNGGECLRNCPSGTYEDTGACQPCINGCKECTSDTECLSCSDTSEYLNAGDQTCVTSCPGSTYTDETNKLCRACASGCTSCTGPSRNCN